MLEIQRVVADEEPPETVFGLLDTIQYKYKIRQCELIEVQRRILNFIKNLRRCGSIEEKPPTYRRKRTDHDLFERVPDILMNKARDCIMKKNERSLEQEVEELERKLYTFNKRCVRELNEILEESAQKMTFMYEDGDIEFEELQEQVAKKMAAINVQQKEYNDLLKVHEQKARKVRMSTVRLQRVIREYDLYVGEVAHECEEEEAIAEQYREWKRTVYEPRKERFTQLRFSRQMVEDELIEKQVEEFRYLHAVRVFQRAWRKILEKQKLKKKKKKGKGRSGKKGGKGKK
ncbi:dynein regulatory complex protein 10-like [Toxorhynchites rutilus septentrionalis]|uniref:dynein regulatory complex protein 10-like n=1 Tax=Toxorhynchites rutilus septentrionalis TaxID=329112 RepID=UPI00247ACD47|nr:dynein regulatory complex protein 10-like [Toxorhynchites rutilus septentrionalis]